MKINSCSILTAMIFDLNLKFRTTSINTVCIYAYQTASSCESVFIFVDIPNLLSSYNERSVYMDKQHLI